MTREEALFLLHEYTPSESLRRHAYAVEAAMRAQARRLGEDEERWGLVGLLHDFDYERWPDPPAHTREGAKILRERGVEEEIIEARQSHAEWNEIPDAARVTLDRTTMNVDGKTVNLTPGMAATVEIKTGKRKLIEFLLSPLMRMTAEAAKER